MKHQKRIVWNPGQVPDRRQLSRMFPYSPPKKIIDDELRNAWEEIIIGEMLVVTEAHYIQSNNYYEESVPYPLMYPGMGGYGSSDIEVSAGTVVVYLGMTNVLCAGAKGRTISKPYATVFYNGGKYLINDQNYLKPLSL